MTLSIPSLWLWTYQIPNDQVTNLVIEAFEIGYRHIDTAQIYENESGIGKAVAQKTVPRDQYRLTTKVRINQYSKQNCRASIEQSLRNLQTDYIDLVLLHRPNTRVGHHEALDALLQCKQEGKIREIGVSNFPILQLQDAIHHTNNQIFINQIEMHPLFDPVNIRTFCQENKVLVSAYSPFAHGRIFDNVILAQIAEKHNATIAQVALAWTLFVSQWIVLPKASSPERLQENLEALHLTLDAEDFARIAALPKNQRRCNPSFHPLRDDDKELH
jgi:2,5-diketo-D-gluconate reductase B